MKKYTLCVAKQSVFTWQILLSPCIDAEIYLKVMFLITTGIQSLLLLAIAALLKCDLICEAGCRGARFPTALILALQSG